MAQSLGSTMNILKDVNRNILFSISAIGAILVWFGYTPELTNEILGNGVYTTLLLPGSYSFGELWIAAILMVLTLAYKYYGGNVSIKADADRKDVETDKLRIENKRSELQVQMEYKEEFGDELWRVHYDKKNSKQS